MSLPDDEHPPASSPPSRDPLLDDPHFAEIVSPPAVFAEPVDAAPEELPVAEVVRPVQASNDPSLPKAVPLREDRPKPIPTVLGGSMPTRAPDKDQPKPEWIAACGVIGCFSICAIGAIAILAWIALMILSHVGQLSSRRTESGTPTPVRSAGVTIDVGPIANTVLVNAVDIKLEGAVDAVCAADGGRFLLFRFPREERLLVFDANKAEVVKSIQLDKGDRNALFAAGRNKVFVYRPQSKQLVRIDLATSTVEAQVPVPPAQLVDAMAIGPDSDGPLYLFTSGPEGPTLRNHNTDTLTEESFAPLTSWKSKGERIAQVKSSFDGRLLTIASTGGAQAIRVNPGENIQVMPLNPRTGPKPELASPSPDGQFIYTSRGVFDNNGKHLVGTSFFAFPTAHGSGLYLSLDVESGKVSGFANIHNAGASDTVALVALRSGELTDAVPANKFVEKTITSDNRVHLWPGAGLLAVLLPDNQTLRLAKIDLATEFKDATRNFVAFATDPPTAARAGEEWQYTPSFWSKSKTKPEISLSEHPEGMTQKGEKLSWTPGTSFKNPVDVVISAKSGDAKAVQKFRIGNVN